MAEATKLADDFKLTVIRGATFEFAFARRKKDGTPLDLKGQAYSMEIQPSVGGAPIILSQANKHVTVDLARARVAFTMPADETAACKWNSGWCVVFVDYPDGKRKRLFKKEIVCD